MTISDLKLLATLPSLVSFTAEYMDFEDGNEETLSEWLAVRCARQGFKRQRSEEKLRVTTAMKRGSPLLLFLHALAVKPSLVRLAIRGCDHLTPTVMYHLPVWPHLRCFALENNRKLRHYPFVDAHIHFPSLTTLSTSNCSDEAIGNLVQLSRLEELRFPRYSTNDGGESVETTAEGFAILGAMTSLRSLVFSPPEGNDQKMPTSGSLAAMFNLNHLTRLTLNAWWLKGERGTQLFTRHLFVHLRCLELIAQYGGGYFFCPQTDSALLSLVKPTHFLVPGRAERQAARHAKRVSNPERAYPRDSVPDIPEDNAANFPALECLALPYARYNCGDFAGQVSGWMMAQLRRSYEFEVAVEWEAERVTLGEAELLKSLA